MSSRLANLTLIFATALLCGGLFEIACRTIVNTGTEYHIEMWKYAVQVKRVSANPAIGHEHRPNARARLMNADVATNSLGLRSPEVGPKQPGRRRVLMLGDSIAFGWGVEADQTMSAVLARTLPETEVIDSGVGNYNTAMEVAYFLDRGIKLEPDVVVLNYFINDAEPTPVYRDVPWLARHAYAYPVLGGAWDTLKRRLLGGPDWQTYYADLYRDGAPGWIQAQEAVMRLAAACRERGIRLVIANIPELRILAPYPFATINARIAALADRAGVPYLDLLPSLAGQSPADLWVTAPDPHPNARAHALMGAALAAYLARPTG